MLIDDITVTVSAGDGGNGAVGFNKIRGAKGPTGASGGKGGDVYLEGVSDLGALEQFRFKKEIRAEKGENGDTNLHDGASAEDLILKVPVGTVVHYLDMDAPIVQEVVNVGDTIRIAKGGRGGRGNFHFRSSRNTTPLESEKGKPGETHSIRLELKLIADVGFIGLPNAGKTSLLNELTNANRKVANYPFTTLEPNIGVYYDLILADIPGIIEGASLGKGLGIKFLRHIERTRTLFHFVSAESEDPLADYKTIREEIESYSDELAKKEEHLFLSKSDLVSKEECDKKLKMLHSVDKNAVAFSLYDDESLKKVVSVLQLIMKKK